MPAAVVGLALVGAEVITVATLSYIAMGVTVAGMVTKNKTLMKIGGQLGLAAGVAGISQAFMGAGAAGAAGAASGAESAAGGAASTAGDVAKVAVGSGAVGNPSQNIVDSTSSPRGPGTGVEWDKAPGYDGPMPESTFNKAPLGYGDPDFAGQFASSALGPGAGQGSSQGASLGATQGLKQGSNLAPTGPSTANDTGGSTKASPDSGFFSFMGSDANKYMAMEGGKIVAGGLQGLAETSRANTQLEENRRIGDIQRANAASIGQSNYRVGGGLMQGR